MKKKTLFATLTIAIMSAFLLACYPPLDPAEKESLLVQTIMNGLKALHFQPAEIDDSFSSKAFDVYIGRLDGGHRWLTKEDLAALEKYRSQMDDEAGQGTFKFFDDAIMIFENALDKTQDFYRQASKEKFDFTLGGSIELDGEKRGWANNDAELKQFWFDWFKYETMTRYADLKEKKEKAKAREEKDEVDEKDYATMSEKDIRAEANSETLEFFDKWYERLRKMKRNDHLSTYLNSLTAVFDPHTTYYEPIDKENFDISMSGKLEGIGARLQTEGEYTKVTDIVVGGPAWKQGNLEENDKITAVKQEGEEPMDINSMTINEVVQLIRGPKGTLVTLTVRKTNGAVKEIQIERDVVITSEGFAKSLIIESENEEKIGYIRLPRFYADFQDRNGRRSAKDVAKEVEKLKKENVVGIVLDLRNNGGGSLSDVVKMSGLFYEDGPIVQVKSRDKKPEVLRDTDSSVQWDGHLIVMVNNFSASASEILAAAMQDYARAVIVGSPTFGKGTVQRFYDLDRAVPGHSNIKPLGQVKLTTQKFYRVNGGSTQLRGVTPDIILPNNYKYIETGEAENDYPLRWTEIAPVTYGQDVYNVKNIMHRIVARSQARVSSSEVFTKIDENAKNFKTQRDDTEYPMRLEDYIAEQDLLEETADKYDNLFDEVVNKTVYNLEADKGKFDGDEGKAARNEDFIEGITKDVYVEEVLNIMHDMITANRIAHQPKR